MKHLISLFTLVLCTQSFAASNFGEFFNQYYGSNDNCPTVTQVKNLKCGDTVETKIALDCMVENRTNDNNPYEEIRFDVARLKYFQDELCPKDRKTFANFGAFLDQQRKLKECPSDKELAALTCKDAAKLSVTWMCLRSDALKAIDQHEKQAEINNKITAVVSFYRDMCKLGSISQQEVEYQY